MIHISFVDIRCPNFFLYIFKHCLFRCDDVKFGTMNGEVPSVPITTLAGISSLTDCKY